MRAVIINNTEMAELLIKKGADVNVTDDDGNTALMWAINHNNTEIVRLILDYGADINTGDNYSRTALMFAVDCQNKEVVKLLLEYEPDVNAIDKDGKTALSYAKNILMINLLKTHGANEDRQTTNIKEIIRTFDIIEKRSKTR